MTPDPTQLASQRRAVAILSQRAADQPQHTEHQRALAITHHYIGVVQTGIQAWDDAEKSLHLALTILATLPPENPNHHDREVEELSVRVDLGELYWQAGRLPAAHAVFQECLRDVTHLTQAASVGAPAAAQLAQLEYAMYRRYFQIGLWDIAVAYSRRNLLLQRVEPTVGEHSRFATLLAAIGDYDTHNEYCRQASSTWLRPAPTVCRVFPRTWCGSGAEPRTVRRTERVVRAADGQASGPPFRCLASARCRLWLPACGALYGRRQIAGRRRFRASPGSIAPHGDISPGSAIHGRHRHGSRGPRRTTRGPCDSGSPVHARNGTSWFTRVGSCPPSACCARRPGRASAGMRRHPIPGRILWRRRAYRLLGDAEQSCAALWQATQMATPWQPYWFTAFTRRSGADRREVLRALVAVAQLHGQSLAQRLRGE